MGRNPKYLEVRDYLVETYINSESGTDILPTEIQLSKQFGVSRMTIRQALNTLRDEGVLRSLRGVGTFVVRTRVSREPTLTSFSDDLRARGYEPSSTLLHAEEVPCDVPLALELGVRPGAIVARIERLRLADGNPICLEDVYLPATRFPGLIERDLTDSLHRVLEKDYAAVIRRAEQQVSAINVTGRTAELLGVDDGFACLHVQRVSMDDQGKIISVGRGICRGDVYDFRYIISRPTA
jgi:GntR family transcriptional regulator